MRRRVEDTLAALGFSEVYTPSLVERDRDASALRLQEPITVELAVLRTELLPSLVEAARRNAEVGKHRASRCSRSRGRICPRGDDELPEERVGVAGIAEGGFLQIKGAVEALLRCAPCRCVLGSRRAPAAASRKGGADRGRSGRRASSRAPRRGVGRASSSTSTQLASSSLAIRSRTRTSITYPAVHQDIAVAVDEDVEAGALVGAARAAAGPLLREARVFDVYRGEQVGEGRKSVAIHLSFQSPERTLTDEEAAELRGRIVAALAETFEPSFGPSLESGVRLVLRLDCSSNPFPDAVRKEHR